ncbi:MAG: hypothetical protein M0Z41_13660 [Peptococcaceae bacterium]|nr:hypothetical protein [Peptococcaceae bacterium]
MPKQLSHVAVAKARAILIDSQAEMLGGTVVDVVEQAVSEYWNWYLDNAARDPDKLVKEMQDLVQALAERDRVNIRDAAAFVEQMRCRASKGWTDQHGIHRQEAKFHIGTTILTCRRVEDDQEIHYLFSLVDREGEHRVGNPVGYVSTHWQQISKVAQAGRDKPQEPARYYDPLTRAADSDRGDDR